MSTSLPRARLGSGAGASPRSSPRTKERGQHQSNTVSGVALEQQKSSQRVNKPVRAGQTVRTEQAPGEHADKEQQKVQIDVVGDMRDLVTKRPPPNSETVNALFQRLVDKLNLPPDQVAELNLKSQDQKWQLILAQHELRAGVECFHYIEQMLKHIDPVLKERKVKSKLLANLKPLGKLLKDLEVDLRSTTDDAWVEEFVSPPNHGHLALLNVLKDVLNCPDMPQHKNPKKAEILDRAPGDLYSCLLCIKALMGHRRGFNALIAQEKNLLILVQCMKHKNKRVKALVLKLMMIILLAPGGNNRILHMFNHYYRVAHERHRWFTLVEAIAQEPIDPTYQSAALTFINTTIQTAPTLNAKVYLQNDFILAGFNPENVEKSLGGRQDERVLHELREWRSNFINVNILMDDLAASRGRTTSLKEELQTISTTLEEEKALNEQLLQQNNTLMSVNASQKSHMDTLQDRMQQMNSVVEQRDTLVEENRQLALANEQYVGRTEEFKSLMLTLSEENQSLKENYDLIASKLSELESSVTVDPETIPLTRNISLLSQSSTTSPSAVSTLLSTPGPSSQETPSLTSTPATEPTIIPPPPPMVPPPPPPPPGQPGAPPPPPPPGSMPGAAALSKSYMSRVRLPMLNWTVIKNITKTVFEELNDKRIVSTLNFREFETLFEARKQSTFEKPASRVPEKVMLFETKRSENLVIAKRRIGQSAEVVMQYILHTDLDGLWGDYCELLLKLIPTKEELTELSSHGHEYDRLGEAEQFMFHLAKIERYHARLKLMVYMSSFDEMYSSVQPKVQCVLNASLELFRSTRLKKIFEVILAFGNYMNSSRRGMTAGFRPDTLGKLTDTKSNNRKMTLLNYIVRVVEAVFPHASTFYEDLTSVEAASQVAIQMLGEDVEALRSGVKLVASELEKQPANFVIFSFHSHAYKKVHQLTEEYKRMDDVYREVCQLFNEEPYPTQQDSSSQSSQSFCNFFTHFQRFIWDWKRASDENNSLTEYFSNPRSLLKGESERMEDEDDDDFVENFLPRATVSTDLSLSLSPAEDKEMVMEGFVPPRGSTYSDGDDEETGAEPSFYKMYTLDSGGSSGKRHV